MGFGGLSGGCLGCFFKSCGIFRPQVVNQKNTRMETHPNPLTRTPRYYYADRHPFYFGNYLNMARHNAYMILNDVLEQFGRDRNAAPVSEESLAGAVVGFYKRLPADRQAGFVAALAAQLPFLACPVALPDSDPAAPPPQPPQGEAAVVCLAAALRALHDLRNAHSHAHHPPVGAPGLSVQYLFDHGAEVLLPRRFGWLQPDDYRHLQRRRTPEFKYDLHDPASGHFTEKGLAFFICLFLERRYAFRFLSRLEGLKRNDTAWARATLQCFTLYCCRLPTPRLDSSDILLDMLNELGRCPDPLYHCLSEPDRDRFDFSDKRALAAADLGPDEPAGIVRTPMKRHDDRFPYFALRFFDDTRALGSLRFHLHLCQRVTDRYPKTIDGQTRERLLLEPVRVFGRWADYAPAKMPPYWKQALDDDTIRQFAPRYNLDGNNIPMRIVDNPGKTTFPSLGKQRAEQPHFILSTYELRNLFLYHYLHREKGWIEQSPEDYLMAYRERFHRLLDDVQQGRLRPATAPPDYSPARVGKFKKPELERLPEHIAFLERSLPTEQDPKRHRLKQQDLERSKRRLAELERYEARKAALGPTILAQYGIRLQDLPDAIRGYLMGIRTLSVKTKAIEKFSTHIKETEQRLEDLAGNRWRRLRAGDLATWIARDILLCKPHQPDGKGMPNSDEYNTLQAKIAYFPVHKNSLPAFFAEQGLTGSDAYKHPFLQQVDVRRCGSVLDFYKAYLIERQRWLNQALRAIRPGKNAPTTAPLSEAEIERRYGYFLQIKNTPALQKHYDREAPVYLPKGLFNRPILLALQANGYPVDPDSDNAAHGLACLLERDSQAFYSAYPRYVRWRPEGTDEPLEWVEKDKRLEQIKADIQRLGRFKKRDEANEAVYRACKSDENHIYEREQAIRYAQSTDQALWLMAQMRAKAGLDERPDRDFQRFRLYDIGFDRVQPDTDDTGEPSASVLDLSVSVQLPYHIEESGRTVVITDQLPIKRHGEFRRFLKDRRIGDLLAYLPAERTEISRAEIEEEIKIYDERREAFFEKIYHFEAALYERYEAAFRATPPEGGLFHHRHYLQVLGAQASPDIFGTLGLDKTCYLRNKLCHNQIPPAAAFAPLLDPVSDQPIAARLFDLANSTYDFILQQLDIHLTIETP